MHACLRLRTASHFVLAAQALTLQAADMGSSRPRKLNSDWGEEWP
jgi:hypothetical protein